jgi:DNA repair exonuclease SbcCD ATPase subunit
MRILKVSFRNFGSYGNKLHTLEIPEEPSFHLIQGKNGHGKSTLSDVIKFAIYGKLENKKLKDIPNRLNRNAFVCIELMTRKGPVKIERAVDPGFFHLYVNGVLIDKAGKRSVQEILEEEILEMPFYVFSNTLSLSINDFKSFLKMNSFDKKAIIDKIFGLQVINQMREILKYQTKKLRDAAAEISTAIDAFSRSLESSKDEFEELEKKIQESSVEKQDQLNAEKLLYEGMIGKHQSNLDKISKKTQTVQDAQRKLNDSKSGDHQLLVNLQEKIELYQNSQCPTCATDLQTDFHQHLLQEYTKQQEEATERYTEKDIKLRELRENLTKLSKLQNEQRSGLTTAKVKLNYTLSQLEEMEVGDVDHQTTSLRKMIENFTDRITEKRDEQLKHQKAVAFYNLAEEILGEKGVKQMAIKSILPALNAEIAKIVRSLGIEHRIIFNEEFDARVSHFGIETSVDTLSTGEMKKIDFGILLAVVRMLKMKYPFVNVLFLDEIFSSLDGDGQYHILKMLREIVKEYQMNIFVISHYPLSYTEFDYKIEISKTNGFSTFEITTVE